MIHLRGASEQQQDTERAKALAGLVELQESDFN
jgi:hypothetical protein